MAASMRRQCGAASSSRWVSARAHRSGDRQSPVRLTGPLPHHRAPVRVESSVGAYVGVKSAGARAGLRGAGPRSAAFGVSAKPTPWTLPWHAIARRGDAAAKPAEIWRLLAGGGPANQHPQVRRAARAAAAAHGGDAATPVAQAADGRGTPAARAAATRALTPLSARPPSEQPWRRRPAAAGRDDDARRGAQGPHAPAGAAPVRVGRHVGGLRESRAHPDRTRGRPGTRALSSGGGGARDCACCVSRRFVALWAPVLRITLPPASAPLLFPHVATPWARGRSLRSRPPQAQPLPPTHALPPISPSPQHHAPHLPLSPRPCPRPCPPNLPLPFKDHEQGGVHQGAGHRGQCQQPHGAHPVPRLAGPKGARCSRRGRALLLGWLDQLWLLRAVAGKV